MVHPVLHFGDLEPGGVAVDAIKAQSKASGWMRRMGFAWDHRRSAAGR
jgi:hypothetical protein